MPQKSYHNCVMNTQKQTQILAWTLSMMTYAYSETFCSMQSLALLLTLRNEAFCGGTNQKHTCFHLITKCLLILDPTQPHTPPGGVLVSAKRSAFLLGLGTTRKTAEQHKK